VVHGAAHKKRVAAGKKQASGATDFIGITSEIKSLYAIVLKGP
jgi:hypothetical protein